MPEEIVAHTQEWPAGMIPSVISKGGFEPLNPQPAVVSKSESSGAYCNMEHRQLSVSRFPDSAEEVFEGGNSIAARLESLERRFPFLGELDLSGALPRRKNALSYKEPESVDLSRLSLQVKHHSNERIA